MVLHEQEPVRDRSRSVPRRSGLLKRAALHANRATNKDTSMKAQYEGQEGNDRNDRSDDEAVQSENPLCKGFVDGDG
eukprot:11276095-Karenia_brevis.AAC.1